MLLAAILPANVWAQNDPVVSPWSFTQDEEITEPLPFESTGEGPYPSTTSATTVENALPKEKTPAREAREAKFTNASFGIPLSGTPEYVTHFDPQQPDVEPAPEPPLAMTTAQPGFETSTEGVDQLPLEATVESGTYESVIETEPVTQERLSAPTMGSSMPAAEAEAEEPDFMAIYDGGFSIVPKDAEKTPFTIKANGWIQFRQHAFVRDSESFTDNAGVTREIRNRNAYDIERARLSLKGFALDERLTYFYQFDGDTDGRHTVDFFDYWWAWKFGDRLTVQFGKRKVSASRQWLLGARRTRFIDRPMTNDFFRPDRTIGLWALGKGPGTMKYEFMIGNGYRTSNLPNNTTDDKRTFAATQYFDPWGDFGSQIVDYDNSREPLMRFGHSFVYSPITSDTLGTPNQETDFLRLTDGTRLNQIGALAPGVTVSGVDVFFYGVDYGFKFRGFSFNSEVFMRWLENFESDGVLPNNRLMQHGFYIEGGRFLIPNKLDVNFRYSEVDGLHGDASEIAAGINWFPLESHKLKCSFDVTVLDGSPLNNTTSDILLGDDGVLFRTQIQAEF